jgi:hypothetical protein
MHGFSSNAERIAEVGEKFLVGYLGTTGTSLPAEIYG